MITRCCAKSNWLYSNGWILDLTESEPISNTELLRYTVFSTFDNLLLTTQQHSIYICQHRMWLTRLSKHSYSPYALTWLYKSFSRWKWHYYIKRYPYMVICDYMVTFLWDPFRDVKASTSTNVMAKFRVGLSYGYCHIRAW